MANTIEISPRQPASPEEDITKTSALAGDPNSLIAKDGFSPRTNLSPPDQDPGTEAGLDGMVGGTITPPAVDTPTTDPVVDTGMPPTPEGTPGVGYSALAGERLTSETPDYAGYVKTQETPDVAKGSTFMTPETTVAGQLEKILKKGSPLQNLAQQRAKEQASALGMMSSTGAIGAGQRALYDEALKVATPDAASATQFMSAEQAMVNEQTKIETEARVAGDLTVQKAKVAEQQKKIDDSFALQLKGLDADTAERMTNLKGNWDVAFKKIDADLTKELQQQEIDANVEQKIMNQAHDMMNQYQISIQQLLGNQAFLESMGGDPDAMHGLFNDMLASTTSAITFAAKAAGVYDEEFSNYLDDLIMEASW